MGYFIMQRQQTGYKETTAKWWWWLARKSRINKKKIIMISSHSYNGNIFDWDQVIVHFTIEMVYYFALIIPFVMLLSTSQTDELVKCIYFDTTNNYHLINDRSWNPNLYGLHENWIWALVTILNCLLHTMILSTRFSWYRMTFKSKQ